MEDSSSHNKRNKYIKQRVVAWEIENSGNPSIYRRGERMKSYIKHFQKGYDSIDIVTSDVTILIDAVQKEYTEMLYLSHPKEGLDNLIGKELLGINWVHYNEAEKIRDQFEEHNEWLKVNHESSDDLLLTSDIYCIVCKGKEIEKYYFEVVDYSINREPELKLSCIPTFSLNTYKLLFNEEKYMIRFLLFCNKHTQTSFPKCILNKILEYIRPTDMNETEYISENYYTDEE